MLAGCASHVTPRGPIVASHAAHASLGRPVFSGAAPARLIVRTRALGVSPDGALRFLVRARFLDARGFETALLSGGDVAFDVQRGNASAQWQTRLRFGGPAAIVSFPRPGVATIVVRASVGARLGAVRVRFDTRRWHGAAIVAASLGPRVVQLGWFPPVTTGTVRIARDAGRGFATIGLATAASFRDTSVVPDRAYRYAVRLPGSKTVMLAARTAPQAAGLPIARLGGKAMWLAFSASQPETDGSFDPPVIVARARAAGIDAIALRVAYGPFSEITPEHRGTIDALLDEATHERIAVLAWTIPRSTAFEDLAAAVALANYRTAAGARFAALAVDLERGDDYLGTGAGGYAALGDYLERLRAALGPRYPLVATVEDPYFEHLTVRDYPYATIAASASVLQPMAYWRMLSKRAVTPRAVRAALRASFETTRRAAGRPIPIDIGGQTAGEAPRGAPPPNEIAAAIAASHDVGAIGITFFDWDGTTAAQWRALSTHKW